MKKRFLLKTTAALLATCAFGLAQAQNTPIKFQLDWRFEGPSALFLTPVAKAISKMPSSTSQLTQATALAPP